MSNRFKHAVIDDVTSRNIDAGLQNPLLDLFESAMKSLATTLVREAKFDTTDFATAKGRGCEEFTLLVSRTRADSRDGWFGAFQRGDERLDMIGQPRMPMRIMIALLYLKHAFNESDEGVVERWGETPTWQFFSGQAYFEHQRPCDANTLDKFRQLLGEEGVEELLAQTINVAVELKLIKPQELKARTPYEFGVKVGIASTLSGNLIVGAKAFHGNPYDGHTLNEQLEQATILMQDSAAKPATAFVALGYRGVDADNPEVHIVHRGKTKRISEQERRLLRRRQAIEPIIGHLKADHRMDRCHLKGETGDRLHAVLCAAG